MTLGCPATTSKALIDAFFPCPTAANATLPSGAISHPRLRLTHLEAWMRATGDWSDDDHLNRQNLLTRLRSVIDALDVDAARDEVSRFVPDPSGLIIWSREFFLEIIERIGTA
jgi:hypothetical protein